MDITPQNTATQPISDDQELAQALAGVLPDEPVTQQPEQAPSVPSGLQFEETPAPAPVAPQAQDISQPADDVAQPEEPQPAAPAFTMPSLPSAPQDTASSDLSDIKASALSELRPLIDHVDLPAEEKFDTYLMLIRSTDDPSLIAPAHAAAQGIADEKQKAEALLDVIKEIDYLSHKDQ